MLNIITYHQPRLQSLTLRGNNMGGDVKCYVDDWESRGKTLADIFDNTAKVTPAQKLGVGQKAYEALMREEEKWEALRDSGEPYPKQSPITQVTLNNLALQGQLKMDNVQFANLMKEESKWEDMRDSGGPYPKTSPLQHATFSKPEGMDSLQFKPTEIPPLDFKR